MVGKTIRSLSFDARKADRESTKNKFKSSAQAEKEFYRALKRVAQQAGHIVDAFTMGATITDIKQMTKVLNDYSIQIEPWARRQAAKLLETVSNSNIRAYQRQSKAMGKALEMGVGQGETGRVALALLNEQVELIKSLPIEAGLRAQDIAQQNFINGQRAIPDPEIVAQLKEEMGMSTEVAVNRAKLIARTETARANASFVQARAQSVGVEGYIWRTTMDGAERESHARMNGRFIKYSSAPTLSDGTTGHAGTFPNCRCYQEPVLPE